MTTVKEAVPEVRHTLFILDKNGDTRVDWNPSDEKSVAEVRTKFDEMVKGLKYLAFTKPADGSMGTAIRDFDPTVEADVYAVPQMQGG